jgi:small-conductance mechanosensitive channel
MTESSGHKVMVPNDSIISSNIENFSTRKNRKTEFILSIDYNTSILKLEK